jgi:hypothetical protein
MHICKLKDMCRNVRKSTVHNGHKHESI